MRTQNIAKKAETLMTEAGASQGASSALAEWALTAERFTGVIVSETGKIVAHTKRTGGGARPVAWYTKGDGTVTDMAVAEFNRTRGELHMHVRHADVAYG